MIIAVIKEQTPGETRVAATPDSVRKYIDLGFTIRIETQAGSAAGFADDDYRQAGAIIAADPQQTCQNADLLLKINGPLPSEDHLLSNRLSVIANCQNLDPQRLPAIAQTGCTCFALEKLPRISRAQSMDVLSSQSNLAGYKAVIEAVNLLPSAVPMLMTAAGTVTPAKVLVLGAGVAGLQAIATAKRLGAQVYASDVRSAVKEQVESLGAKFVEVKTDENFETSGGYASETSDEYKQAQELAVAEQLSKSNIVITTALIPGKPAPKLIKSCMLDRMPRGSIIIDMATASGGNVDGSQNGKTINLDHVTIVGNSNLAAGVPNSASRLFANNIFNFLNSMYHQQTKQIVFNFEDILISSTCIVRQGQVFDKE